MLALQSSTADTLRLITMTRGSGRGDALAVALGDTLIVALKLALELGDRVALKLALELGDAPKVSDGLSGAGADEMPGAASRAENQPPK